MYKHVLKSVVGILKINKESLPVFYGIPLGQSYKNPIGIPKGILKDSPIGIL